MNKYEKYKAKHKINPTYETGQVLSPDELQSFSDWRVAQGLYMPMNPGTLRYRIRHGIMSVILETWQALEIYE